VQVAMPSHMETAATNAKNRRTLMARGAVVCLIVCVMFLRMLFTRAPYAGEPAAATSASAISNRRGPLDASSRDVEYSWADSYSQETYSFLKYPAPAPAAGTGMALLQPYCSALQMRYTDAAHRDKLLASHAGNGRAGPGKQGGGHAMPAYLSSLPGAAAADKLAGVSALLAQYMQEHSRSALQLGNVAYTSLLPEQRLQADIALCRSNHSYVIGVYSCPQQLGNRIHEFLNAYAAAVITNRTLIWKFCDRPGCSNKDTDCSPFLRLAPGPVSAAAAANMPNLPFAPESWIPDGASVISRLRNGGCEYPSYKFRRAGTVKSSGGPWRYEHHVHRRRRRLRQGQEQDPERKRSDSDRTFLNGVSYNQVVPHSLYSTAGEAVVACCGIDTIWNERVLDVGSLERREMFALAFPGANLGPRAFERTARLFSGGADLAYGLLLRSAFEFTPAVHEWNQRVKFEVGVESAHITRSRRRLTKDPVPDDDAPLQAVVKPVKNAFDKKHKSELKKGKGKHREHAAPRTDSGQAGRQVLPSAALALEGGGKTTIKSSQGTSVGPQAGGTDVLIVDAGGSDAAAKAVRAGAAPQDDVKSAVSPDVKPLVQRPAHAGKRKPSSSAGGQVGVLDPWARDFAGNFTALAEAGGHSRVSRKRDQNGIGSKAAPSDVFLSAPTYQNGQSAPGTSPVQRPPRVKAHAEADELLNKLYTKDDVAAQIERLEALDAGSATADSRELGFVLSVHLRHMSRGDTGEQDKRGELSCVRSVLEQHVPGFNKWQADAQKLLLAKQKVAKSSKTDKSVERAEILEMERALPKLGCTVLLASDRAATIVRMREAVEALGCAVAFAPRVGPIMSRSAEPAASLGSEHGPFRDGVLPVADLELLSHADAFIGSGDDRAKISSGSDGQMHPAALSTYSLLLAGLIASNTRNKRHIKDNPNFNILTAEKAFLRWLPSCGAGFGSYLVSALPLVEPLLTSDQSVWDSLRALNLENGVQAAAEPWQGAGNGHYEPTDCPFFSWNRQCVNEKVMGVSDICNEGKERAKH